MVPITTERQFNLVACQNPRLRGLRQQKARHSLLDIYYHRQEYSFTHLFVGCWSIGWISTKRGRKDNRLRKDPFNFGVALDNGTDSGI